MIYQWGDVKITEIANNSYLAISCDSIGAIGDKEMDKVNVPSEWIGRVLARVSLMELLALRVEPFLLVNTLSVEMNPTGEKINAGIRTELETVGLDPEQSLTGSHESNITTSETGAGITALGKCSELPKTGLGYPGLNCYLLGTPKVGGEVDLKDNDLVNLAIVKELGQITEVLEMIPVGSQGIKYETEVLAQRSSLTPKFLPDVDSEFLNKSGGPSTCLVFTADDTGYKKAKEIANRHNTMLRKLAEFDYLK